MTARHILPLTPSNRAQAIAGIDAAIARNRRGEKAWTLELREAKRSDDQNRALWGLLRQVAAQRPTHNGVKMTDELWKCVFLNALGTEMRMLPNLDGTGFFPLGHRSSVLTKTEFSALLEIILCWAAQEGLTVEHFGEPEALAGARAAA